MRILATFQEQYVQGFRDWKTKFMLNVTITNENNNIFQLKWKTRIKQARQKRKLCTLARKHWTKNGTCSHWSEILLSTCYPFKILNKFHGESSIVYFGLIAWLWDNNLGFALFLKYVSINHTRQHMSIIDYDAHSKGYSVAWCIPSCKYSYCYIMEHNAECKLYAVS